MGSEDYPETHFTPLFGIVKGGIFVDGKARCPKSPIYYTISCCGEKGVSNGLSH